MTPEERSLVDNTLATIPPAQLSDHITCYLEHCAEALRIVCREWPSSVDQPEALALLQALISVHKTHAFRVEEDEGRPTLYEKVKLLRQSADREVASAARELFARFCLADTSKETRIDVVSWKELLHVPA